MQDAAFESIAESLALIGEVIAMILLTVVGVFAESAGIDRLGAGLDPLAIWYIFVGGLALYTSVYMLGYRRFLPHLRARFRSDGGAN